MKEKLTIQVEEELMQRFRLIAVKERKTLSEILRTLIDSYVQAREKPQPPY